MLTLSHGLEFIRFTRADLLQCQLAAAIIELLKAIKAVATVTHQLAGLKVAHGLSGAAR
jgi:hypothetical protein